jgi:GntR family transcriptional regulator
LTYQHVFYLIRGVKAPVPKYFLIRSILESRLERTAAIGDRLPSEVELGVEFEVSRITIQQALTLMEKDGLVRRERGRGTFYLGPSTRRRDAQPNQLLESLIRSQPDSFARVISTSVIPASPLVISRLKLAKGSSVVAIDRVGIIADEPILFIYAYLPMDIGSQLLGDKRLLTKFTLGELVRNVCGIEISSVVQTIAATLADSGFAKHLGVEIGAPVLEGERTYCDQNGRPVIFSDAFYRADRHRFLVNVSAPAAPQAGKGSASTKKRSNIWSVV